jgi:hypothetical protein
MIHPESYLVTTASLYLSLQAEVVRVRFHGMLELEEIEGRRSDRTKKAVTLFPCKHAIG